MTHMVYWYGSYDDPGNAYSLVPSSNLVPYEVGLKKGYGIGKSLQKKIDENKKLTKNDALIIRGVEELKIDLEKDPKDRQGQIQLEIKEFWEFSDDEEDDLESEPPTPEPKATKKRKKKTGDDDNKEDAKPKKRGRKKGSNE